MLIHCHCRELRDFVDKNITIYNSSYFKDLSLTAVRVENFNKTHKKKLVTFPSLRSLSL